jgi:hypothetical protein
LEPLERFGRSIQIPDSAKLLGWSDADPTLAGRGGRREQERRETLDLPEISTISMRATFLHELFSFEVKETAQILKKVNLLTEDPTPDAHTKKQLEHLDGEKEKLAGSVGEEGGPAEWTRHTLYEIEVTLERRPL